MSDETPLSLESAMALIRVAPATSESPAAPDPAKEPKEEDKTPAAEAAATETPPAEAGEQPPAETEGAEDTPADQGETKDEKGDQGDALPPIDPPSSWNTEEKAVWESLPRKAQEAVLRREQDRTAELRKVQNSTAEQRKAADAEVTRLKGLSDQITTHLNDKVAELASDFPEIKSEADVLALAQRDPARYSVFRARLDHLGAANQAAQQAKQEIAAREQAHQQENLAKAKDALFEAFPAWKNPEVARREIVELQDYAIKEGAAEAAARSNLDPVVFKLAQKAMLYDRAQAAKASAVKRDPPRVVKPGTPDANPKVTAKEDTRRAQLSRLDKTGDLEDAVGLLRL